MQYQIPLLKIDRWIDRCCSCYYQMRKIQWNIFGESKREKNAVIFLLTLLAQRNRILWHLLRVRPQYFISSLTFTFSLCFSMYTLSTLPKGIALISTVYHYGAVCLAAHSNCWGVFYSFIRNKFVACKIRFGFFFARLCSSNRAMVPISLTQHFVATNTRILECHHWMNGIQITFFSLDGFTLRKMCDLHVRHYMRENCLSFWNSEYSIA